MHTALAIFRVDYLDKPGNDVVPTEIVKAIEAILEKHGGGTTQVISAGVSGKKI